MISIKWIDNWNIEVRVPPEHREVFLSKVTYKSKDYRVDFSRPKVGGRWQMSYQDTVCQLYTTNRGCNYYFNRGFAPYINYHFDHLLSENDKLKLSNKNPYYEEIELDGLYDYQNEHLDTMFKYKSGLFSCSTGYGKTQVISLFSKYLVNKGYRVLICTPSSNSLNELKLRYAKLNGEDTYEFSFDKEINFINLKGFPRRSIFTKRHDDIAEYMNNVDVIICDEAEYCTSAMAKEVFYLVRNPKMIYAFSGTCDKLGAEPISIKSGIQGTIKGNEGLAGLIGFTLVYQKPQGYKINIHKYKTDAFDSGWGELADIKFTDEGPVAVNPGLQLTLLHKNHDVGSAIESVVRKHGLTFIPMVALKIIDFYNENYFYADGEVTVIISSRGIEKYTANQGKKDYELITLADLKELVKLNKISVIFGTKSAFNAIDLPGLTNVMPLTNKLASAVIQYVGRAARMKEFNVLILQPNNRRIPVYKDSEARLNLIRNYYSNCDISNYEYESI